MDGGDGNEWAADFIYMISLDEDDRCVSYKEWNVVGSRKQQPPLMESYRFSFERPDVVRYFEHIESCQSIVERVYHAIPAERLRASRHETGRFSVAWEQPLDISPRSWTH